jgi:hypothetical protein
MAKDAEVETGEVGKWQPKAPAAQVRFRKPSTL